MGTAALAAVSMNGAVAAADTPAPSTISVAVTSVRELPDSFTGVTPTPTSAGAYRGDVTVLFSATPDAGEEFDPSTATATYLTSNGTTSQAVALNAASGYLTLDSRTLPDGDNSIEIHAMEKATGDPDAPSTPVVGTLILPTANPSAVFTSPAPRSVAWGSTTWTVDAQAATGGAPIDHVEFWLLPVVKQNKPTQVDSSPPYTYTATYSGNAGIRQVHAVAVDKDGNRSAIAGDGVYADPGPTVTISRPQPLLDADGARTYHFDWAAHVAPGWNEFGDDHPELYDTWLTEVVFAVDGQPVQTLDPEADHLVCPRPSPYHCAATIPYSWELDATGWKVGTHTVTVTVTDSRGGVNHASVTAVVGPDRLTVTGGPRAVTLGQAVGFHSVFTSATGDPLPGASVALQTRKVGSTVWTTVATGRTSATGAVDLSTVPAQNESVRFAALSGTKPLSTTTPVSVAPKVSIKASATSVTHGRSIVITGIASSKESGASVKLLVYRNGAWVSMGSRPQSSTGQVSFTVLERTAGSPVYRLQTVGTTRFAGAYSSTLTVHVR